MENQPYDQEKAEAFADNLLSTFNSAASTLMISLGHRTGIFDIMQDMPPSTSAEIAKAASLNERYVREWLNALVTSHIIIYDKDRATYKLPLEHAAFLTRQSSPNNMAVIAQFIPVLAYVENEIVQAFKEGGGVPYEAYNRFHEVMSEESGQTVVSSLLDSILPLVDGLIERLESGITVLDIGCGYGKAINMMAEKFVNSTFYGYDICPETIEKAQMEAESKEISNVFFQRQDLAQWQDEEKFDFITAFDVIHDQAHPEVVLKNVYHALKANGVFLAQDIKTSTFVENNIDHILGPLIYTISCMHCMTVSLAQNGAGLGAAWGEELAEEMFKKAGFKSIEKCYLKHDIVNTYYILKKNNIR
ncbi:MULTISPECIES: class I SAM-dependent methyltransferase [Legionella]|uniref:Methyltransferase domain-containing protein n=1 Tax=Legionella resiliens TaxID=2905958 RepID=A0ABS8X296_9GAMM|nr:MULTISPECIES: methyltransferase domain-containing protein [unclassified Legionella]MCE0722599.1 methyltransferase domain-containing protein [Legionella sp. 9fVS26]MCE3531752.1 methyltransferase domain-containing protein [Legionella sp. 8cVS16]QLZ67777.1 Trans-aconitate 2-methyltransferase [Legionella sp. PC1000]